MSAKKKEAEPTGTLILEPTRRILRLEIKLDDDLYQSGCDVTVQIYNLFDCAKQNVLRALADKRKTVMIHPSVGGIAYNDFARLSVVEVPEDEIKNWTKKS